MSNLSKQRLRNTFKVILFLLIPITLVVVFKLSQIIGFYLDTYTHLPVRTISKIVIDSDGGLKDSFRPDEEIGCTLKKYGRPDSVKIKHEDDVIGHIQYYEYGYDDIGLIVTSVAGDNVHIISIVFTESTINKIQFYDNKELSSLPSPEYIRELYGEPNACRDQSMIYNLELSRYIFHINDQNEVNKLDIYGNPLRFIKQP